MRSILSQCATCCAVVLCCPKWKEKYFWVYWESPASASAFGCLCAGWHFAVTATWFVSHAHFWQCLAAKLTPCVKGVPVPQSCFVSFLFIQHWRPYLIREDMLVSCPTFAEWLLTPSAVAAVFFQGRRSAADKLRWRDAPWLDSVLWRGNSMALIASSTRQIHGELCEAWKWLAHGALLRRAKFGVKPHSGLACTVPSGRWPLRMLVEHFAFSYLQTPGTPFAFSNLQTQDWNSW